MAGSQSTTTLPCAETATIIPFRPKTRPPVQTLTIDEVPFFKNEGGRRRNFLAINPPTEYGEACHYGEDLACILLRYKGEGQHASDFAQILRWIVHDQIARGSDTAGDSGALVGFWGVIGSLAGYNANPKVAKMYEARHAAQRERYREFVAKQKQERSERARRAALIGAAKRRNRKAAPTSSATA